MKINKTNVARLLDKAKVAYQLVPYEVDENDLSATHVADQLGENVAQVFKTLVLHGDKSGYFVCVIPGADEVDLKKAAKVSGNKSCEMIPVKVFKLNNGTEYIVESGLNSGDVVIAEGAGLVREGTIIESQTTQE